MNDVQDRISEIIDVCFELVGFALNHASAHKITEGYITKDYSPINTLNNAVLEFVFGSQ